MSVLAARQVVINLTGGIGEAMVRATMPDATRDALIALGWTPPPHP